MVGVIVLYWALKDHVGQIRRKMLGEVGVKEGERSKRVCLETQRLLESMFGALSSCGRKLRAERRIWRASRVLAKN
jgi:hypothetical protein